MTRTMNRLPLVKMQGAGNVRTEPCLNERMPEPNPEFAEHVLPFVPCRAVRAQKNSDHRPIERSAFP